MIGITEIGIIFLIIFSICSLVGAIKWNKEKKLRRRKKR